MPVSDACMSGMTPRLVKDYTLDKMKAFEKKKEGCNRDHMKSEMKQGKNLVIQFSTAAYEHGKACLEEILYDKENFPYSIDKRESMDQEGGKVDICYKIFNTKADGSCGKQQKFIINCYNTTSLFLINGCKIDIFFSDIYDKLFDEMKQRCQ